MNPDSQEKTAFITSNGLYEFTVMSFGLCYVPATFQRLMESVLAKIAREKCLVYLDDVLVMGSTLEEHLSNLREVLTRLAEAGLKLKPSKCKLVHKKVEYLGYVVSSSGIAADPKKIYAVENFPRSTDLKSLRSFLGLTSYYRRFIPNYSIIAQPMYKLTHKDVQYQWCGRCEEAFTRLKQALTNAPVLAYPCFEDSFLLETDASGEGLGAVLSQRQNDKTIRPIAYASRTLQSHVRNYGISELEGLGVLWAVKHFRHYLYGHYCTVYTDHEALKSLLHTPHPSGKLARWGMALQELDLTIEYRPGKGNQKADALSRYPISLLSNDVLDEPASAVVAVVGVSDYHEGEQDREGTLANRQRMDPYLREVNFYLDNGVLPEDETRARELVLGRSQYEILDGVLYRVEADKSLKIVVPASDRERLFVTGFHITRLPHTQNQTHVFTRNGLLA